MTLIETVDALTTNITKANEVWAAMEPLKKEFDELSKPLTKLDKMRNYFGVKPDGNALVVSFNQQNGMPEFRECLPLPEEQFAADQAAQAEADHLAAAAAAAAAPAADVPAAADGEPTNVVNLATVIPPTTD
jgi:hypothetical protein